MKKVTMYSGTPCSYCEAAKALLKSKNIHFDEIDVWISKDKAKKSTWKRDKEASNSFSQKLKIFSDKLLSLISKKFFNI